MIRIDGGPIMTDNNRYKGLKDELPRGVACHRPPLDYNIPPTPPGLNLTDFYEEYYSPHPPGYMRELRTLPLNPKKPKEPGIPDKTIHTVLLNPVNMESHIRRLHYHWVRNQSYYASTVIRHRRDGDAVLTRLSFDFDEEVPPEVKDLKRRIHSLHIKCRHGRLIEMLRNELAGTITRDEVGAEAYDEAREFVESLRREWGAEAFMYYSGMKGVHVTVEVHPLPAGDSLDGAIKRLTMEYCDQYSTMDPAVGERQTRRVDKIPYTPHFHTGLYSVPVTNGMAWAEVLEEAQDPLHQPGPGLYSRRVSDELTYHIHELSWEIEEELATKRVKRKARQARLTMYHDTGHPKGTGGDLREQFTTAYGEPERATDKYSVWYCRIHKDQGTPNLHVYKDHWHCYACRSHGYSIKDYAAKIKDKR